MYHRYFPRQPHHHPITPQNNKQKQKMKESKYQRKQLEKQQKKGADQRERRLNREAFLHFCEFADDYTVSYDDMNKVINKEGVTEATCDQGLLICCKRGYIHLFLMIA